MLKKFPYLALVLAVLLFFWFRNQQGKDQDVSESAKDSSSEFDRSVSKVKYTRHARCRMECRFIDESEVKEMIKKGRVNREKIEVGSKGTTFPLEGVTHDGQHVRVVVAPHPGELVIVTVIDLEKEWPCNCN